VRGTADLGQAEYQMNMRDAAGLAVRFAHRAHRNREGRRLGATDLLAIHRLGGAKLGDHYVADQRAVERLLNSACR